MLSFYKIHPEYIDSDFYITGESYAGKYIPNMAVSILNHNEAKPASKINLSGIMIGNPYVDAIIQRLNIRHSVLAAGIINTD